MKKHLVVLIVALALSDCSISIESKSIPFERNWGEPTAHYEDAFVQNQTITNGELLTLVNRGREVDIVPQFSEVVKPGSQFTLKFRQLDWTYGIELQVLV